LVFRGGKLLITKRFPDAHLGGLWEFPGGKREPNETYEQCLVRELREELAIEVSVGPLVEELTHDYPEKTVHLKFFQCDWTAHEPRPIGCAEVVWIDVSQLGDYDFPAADAKLLHRLQTDTTLRR